MAEARGQDTNSLTREVAETPWDFDFFEAVRAIECAFPHLPRVGRSRTLADDPIRFSQKISLAFAPSTLAQPNVTAGAVRRLAVNFFGLTGPNGPLPLRLTEFIRNRLRGISDPDLQGTNADPALEGAARDATLTEFLDLFHHRMISLFYRAWAVAQKTADFDREEDSSFAEWIASLFGAGLPEMDGLDAIPTWRKLAFAGHLSNQTRHPCGLEGILTAAFATRAEVHSLTGHWLVIPPDQRCYLGKDREFGSMGTTCVVGSKIWDRRLKFTIRLGPVSLAHFQTFLPGGASHRPLHDWIAFYTRRELYWVAIIVLKREEVPKSRLGVSGLLGYTTWLSSRPFDHDPEDYRVRGGGLSPAENS